MPFLFLQFPAFDPVLVSIGPFPIRWYALAYIVGILLGWLYARALIRNERLWGGPAPLTLVDFDDFVLWVTLGIILGGRTGYVLFYNPAHFLAASARSLAAVEGRHVVPRRLRRLRAGGRAVRAAARHLDPVARRPHLRDRHRSGCFSAASPTSSTASCGVARPTCPGLWCFRAAGRCRAIRASSTRRRLEGLVLFVVLWLFMRAGALKRPGLVIGAFAVGYSIARIVCEFFREPDPQLGFLWGGLTMGMLLSVPLMLDRLRLHRRRA